MDRSTRNLLIGLLLVILVIAIGSATFVVGLNIGRTDPTNTLAVTARPSVDSEVDTTAELSPEAEASGATSSPLPATSVPPRTSNDQGVREQFEVFWEVYDLINSDFLGEIPDDADLTNGAIRGMLLRLDDDFTSFIEPNLAAIGREDASGRFQGIGALVRINDNLKLEIIRTFDESPAQRSGLTGGDQVIAVDGESIIGYGIYEAIALIRGPANSDVTLTVERDGVDEAFDITITRAEIEIPLVETRMIGSDIAYVALSSFEGTSTDQLRRELEVLFARNPDGLILDLRDNPGGFLDESISVSDLFLGDGIVVIERHRDGREDIFRSHDGDLAEDIPLAVLVNVGSASASEIVAGAIQDHGRGTLIGTITFGKGSVQRVHTLSNGAELRVTTALWFTPNDRAINGAGLEPDIVVVQEEGSASDAQLDRAVEFLRNGE